MSQTQQSPEKIWFQKKEYEEAEKQFYENLAQVKQGNSPPSALPNKQPQNEVTNPNPQSPSPPAKKQDAQVENPTKGGGGKKSNKKTENKETEKGSKGKKQVVIEEAPPKVESPTSEKTDLPEKIAIASPPKKPDNEKAKNENAPKKPAEVKPKEGPVDPMGGQGNAKASLASEVAKARQHIKSSLECIDGIAAMAVNNLNVDLTNRVNTLEIENSSLKKQVSDLTGLLNTLSLRVSSLEKTPSASPASKAAPAPKAPSAASQPPKKAAKPDDDDDGVDLFGSDSEEEDDEAKKVREQRLAEYNAKKSKKPVLIAKSNIILDVKPWDDETDMKVMEEKVRTVQTDGLIWGASKLVPLAFGIHKLQISCVVEDDKVSVDWLQENIEAFEDLVQSVDIAAFNKV